MKHIPAHQARRVALVLALLGATSAARAQPVHGQETQGRETQIREAVWPPTSDALEVCIAEEEKSYSTGHACIGKHARQCLEIAQRDPVVHVEKCYEPELAAWARLVKRYFDQRPRDAKGQGIAKVQHAWLAYRKLKCDDFEFHHGGSGLGRSQSLICLLEETGRRAIELRSQRAKM